MSWRALILALAIVAGCGSAVAVEKSYTIVFKDNGLDFEPTLSDNITASTVNAALGNYIEGTEFVSGFNSSKFKKIYQAKEGRGWRIGYASENQGIMQIYFSKAGQANATKVKVTYISAGTTKCVIYANSDSPEVYNLSLTNDQQVTFTHHLSAEKLESLYISNWENSTDNKPFFYLLSIQVFYEEEEEEEEEVVTDPEMKTGEGAFAQSGTDFSCGEGKLHFDNIVKIANGAALFNSDNRLTVSAPAGYFLAGVEFKGASAEGVITATSGSVTAGKWLPAEGDIALNAVEFKATSQESLTGVKISYLPFRIDHSLTTSTIDFAATEGTANSINIRSSFANSNRSSVDKFIIRANGTQIAEAEADATEASFTGLPYLTDGRLTISPVIGGTERQPELLEGSALPNLDATDYTIAANMLLCEPSDDKTTCTIGAVIRLSIPEDIPAALYNNFEVTVANHSEAKIQPGDGFIDIYIPTYFTNVPYSDGQPILSGLPFEKFTVTITPTYQFYVNEAYRPLLTSPASNRLKVSALGSDGIQTVTFDAQQLEAQFNNDSSVSHLPTLAAEQADTTARYYTLQGVEVSATDLTPGLYIERRGTRTTLYLHR